MFKKLTFQPNPIIIKELRSRMRGARPFITLTGMLLLLSGITYAVYRLMTNYGDYYSGTPLSPQIGQTLFTMLIYLLLLFILIVTPAVTANTVSREKENLTYEMLMTTPLHPAKILWGKLVSAMSYVFLLIFAAIPIASLIFVFGGVALRDMLKAIIILSAIAISTGIFGLFMSTLLKRSTRTIVISYVLIAILIIGTVVVYGMVGVFRNAEPPRWILVLNPVSVLASGISNIGSNSYSYGFIPILAADFSSIDGSTFGVNYIPRPLYHYSLPIYAFISLILFSFATRFLRPTRRWKISRKEVFIFLAILFTLVAVVLGGLLATRGSYENAVSPNNAIGVDLFGPSVMVEPARPDVVVAPAQPVILELSDNDLSSIYTVALTNAIDMLMSSDNSIPSDIQLVQVLQTSEVEPSDYSIAENTQVSISAAIVETFSDLSFNLSWVSSLEEANSAAAESDTNPLIITFSTMAIGADGTAKSTLFGYENGELVFQFIYTITTKGGEWFIIESEFSQF